MPFLKREGIPQYWKSGVYVLTNAVNGKAYVGSATCLRGRLMAHRRYLRIGKHDNSYLQRAWTKYGEAAFRYDVLEVCDVGELIEREQHWIDSLKAAHRNYGYNLAPQAGGTRGYKWSEEACRKMSEDRKGSDTSRITALAAIATKGKPRPKHVRDAIGNAQRIRIRTEEEKAKIKANHWSRRPDAAEIAARSGAKQRGKVLSAEHRAKIAASGRRRWKAFRESLSN